MKEINTLHVLNVVRKAGTIPRRDLVTKTGLTTGTITNIIKELLEGKLLLEVGSGKSMGGRKPINLELNPEAGYAVGIELNTTEIICILSDFQAKVIDKLHTVSELDKGKDYVIEKIVGLIEKSIESNNIEKGKVLGVGLAIPGPYDHSTGRMLNPPKLPGWKDVPIKEIIAEKTGIRTYIGKETFCAALAEYWFGKALGFKKIFAINVYDSGVGGGMVMEGNSFHGFIDGGMDIGHTVVQVDGYPCSCGNKGCLEAYADGKAAVRYALEALENGEESLFGKGDTSLDELISCAEAGDKVSVEAIDQCAYYLNIAAGNIISIIDPDIIYFSGYFIEKCPGLFDKTVEYLDQRPFLSKAKKTIKVRSSFGKESGAMGALAMVFDDLSKTK